MLLGSASSDSRLAVHGAGDWGYLETLFPEWTAYIQTTATSLFKKKNHFKTNSKLHHTSQQVNRSEFSHTAPGETFSPLCSVHGERDAALHAGEECRSTDWRGDTRQHLPGRNSSESKTIVNVTQSQSCRLAVICGPLLPIPIHSVRMELLDCFSSTLRLREIRQKFVFLPKRCHSKGAPVFRAAL